MSARTLCLNMIVRDEAAVLSRALLSVADHIAYWVICDTGSTDQTRELVQSIFAARDIPGELHSFDFENFAQARNAALDRARASAGRFDYLLLMDADMELVVDDPAFRQHLTAPSYRVRQKAGISYWNTRLLRREASARYHGVTHEYVDRLPDEAALDSIWFVDHADGANRPGKYDRDIRLLQDGLASEPHNSRYAFYLAQSYRDAGRLRDAADAYARRVTMEGWDEETWYAQLQEARCRLHLGDDADFVAVASKAFDRRPHRAEPLYELAKFYRLRDLHEMAMTFCQVAAKLPWPKDDRLFIEDFVYAVGIREEISISGFYCKSAEHQEAGRRACYDLAVDRTVPESTRNLARYNQTFYAQAATSLLPSLNTWPLTFEAPATGNLMNPSVAIWDGTVCMLVRGVNYCINESGHYDIANGRAIETRNYLLRLDSELRPDAWSEIHPPADLPPPRYSYVRGFEDARLFAWRDSLWCSSTVRELNAEGWCEIVLAKIDSPLTPSCRLTQWRVLESEGPRRHQKNWMPQVSERALRFIYSVDPTRIVDERGRTISEMPPLPALGHLRGGSNAIAFDGGWLALTHEVSHFNQRPVYLHRFAWFDEAMVVKSTTVPFYFIRRGIEFAAGLAWHPDGERLIMTFGVNDAEARIGTVLADDIRTALADGGQPNDRSSPAAAERISAPASANPSLSGMREKSVPSTLTFVTCLFDLPRWDGERSTTSRNRTLHGNGGYLSLAKELLRQPVPLVIFTEEHLLKELVAFRPPDTNTRYHTLALEELPLFADIYPALGQSYRERYHRHVNPAKDTPAYLVLVNSKWSMLRRVADDNPFETPFIGWIDIGLRHVVGSDVDLLPRFLAAGASHPDCLCLAMPDLNDHVPPRDAVMRQYWGRIYPGLLTMPTRDAAIWERLCSDYLRAAVRDGYYPFEGELLYRLLLRMGKLIGEPDPDVTPAELLTCPDVHPYRAYVSEMIRFHPAVSRAPSGQRPFATLSSTP